MNTYGQYFAAAREALSARRVESQRKSDELRRRALEEIPELRENQKQLDALRLSMLRSISNPAAATEDRAVTQLRVGMLLDESERLLISHGFPKTALETVYRCPKCSDTGILENGHPCECLLTLTEQLRARDRDPAAPSGSVRFSDFDVFLYPPEYRRRMQNVLEVCSRYASGFSPGADNLLLQGGTGLGKTMLSGCIARAVSGKGYFVVYRSVAGILASFEAQKFEHSAEASEQVNEILTCDLLIIDDLGTEMITNFTQSVLYQIINGRLNANRSTVISTNLDAPARRRVYSEQLCSRLEGAYNTLAFYGNDIRMLLKNRE